MGGKDRPVSDRLIEQRLKGLTAIIVAFFLIFAGRLWLLQIVRGESFDRLAEANRVRTIPIRAPRGLIVDAKDRLLVTNRLSYTVSVVPSGLRDADGKVAERLADLLGLTVEEIHETLSKGSDYPYEPIRLKRDVPLEVAIAIEEDRNNLPGVFVEEEWVRMYPHGSLAGHVLGYLGEADRNDLAAGYRPKDLVGKDGIEASFEMFLRGEEGKRLVEVNALSRPIRDLSTIAPNPGLDVYLTLDMDLQRVVEQALVEGMERLKEQSSYGLAGKGAAVVLDAKSGAVLAMASLPGVDLSRLHSDERDRYFSSLSRDPDSPMLNRALQAFAPGSTYKVVTAIAALESGTIEPDTVYHADGYGPEGRRDWTVAAGLPPAGPVTVVEALGRSANDFFWEMALRPEVGNDYLAHWATNLGLGQPIGLPLKEKSGVVPTAAYKRALNGQPWVRLDTMNVAIGQGFTQVTPLQMAQLYMIIANEGVARRIHLVRRIAAADGRIAFEMSTNDHRIVPAKKETWKAVKEGLRSVVQWQRGTAYNAFVGAPYDPAGKTGTAQNSGTAAHGWFAGFAPASDPEIVVVVFAQWGEGGARAAPIAREIMDYYFLGPAEERDEESP